VLLHLWDKRQQLPDVQNVRSYLLTCLRHELLAELRSVSSRTAKYKQMAAGQSETESSWEECIISLQTNAALRERLTRAINKLTEREKELLQLKFFEDLDYNDIAARCGITKRTAYNIIHTALKTLKNELAQHDKPLTVNPVFLLWAIGLLS
jgi:RNA polymerase sigma-70 factor (ECF subfamily)